MIIAKDEQLFKRYTDCPIAIVVPCRRVIGSDGGLAGYAYGPDIMRWLLEHEYDWRGEMNGKKL